MLQADLGPPSLSHLGCRPYFYLLTRLLAAISKPSAVGPCPLGRCHVRPRFQSVPGSLEEEKEKTDSVSPNSHFCLLGQEGHQALLGSPSQPCSLDAPQAVDCVMCGTHPFTSLRGSHSVLPFKKCLKNLICFSRCLKQQVNLVPLWPEAKSCSW